MSTKAIQNFGGGPVVVTVPPRPCKCWYAANQRYTHDEPAGCNAAFFCMSMSPYVALWDICAGM